MQQSPSQSNSQKATRKIIDCVEQIEGMEVMGDPKVNMIALRATDFDIFPLGEDMKERGWFIQPQFGYANSGENMHLSVGYHNAHMVDEFCRDLSELAGAQRAAQQGQQAFELPEELSQFIQEAGHTALDHMGDILGSDGSALPGRMDEVNQILNQLPAATREVLLGEFINRLYNPQQVEETAEEKASSAKNLGVSGCRLARLQVEAGEHKSLEHYFFKEVIHVLNDTVCSNK